MQTVSVEDKESSFLMQGFVFPFSWFPRQVWPISSTGKEAHPLLSTSYELVSTLLVMVGLICRDPNEGLTGKGWGKCSWTR